MIYKNEFQIGQRLELEVIDNDYKNEKVLISQLLEMDKNKNIYIIANPIYQGNLVAIPLNLKLYVFYSAGESGVFYFEAKIIKRKKDPIPHLVIKQTRETRKIQRREYYRLEKSIEIDIFDENNEYLMSGYTKDISGGGLRFICEESFSLGKVLWCQFKIENKEFYFRGNVIRSEISDEELEKYDTSIEFLEMKDEDRNYIVRYIFKEQRILRQKGLI
ncbi:MAG: flagellar brake protein [Peptostreptococcaceae bacterium]|jgi:c-di-GMP-binding flagellar brake protein YcgR|nr:flagellar brake protein [Peptostreptococcaceae bacterium]